MNHYFERTLTKHRKEEDDYFEPMIEGLKNSLDNIKNSLKSINDWDELLNLNSEEEFYKDIIDEKDTNQLSINLNNSRIIPYEFYREPQIKDFYTFWSQTFDQLNNNKCCLIFCFICGFLFLTIQLIGVQLGIIILNALFDEIVDEFRLSGNDITKKEYNFYEKLEIASYKSIPEIDVGMFWSFLGLFALKKYGFNWSNIFQVLSLIGFILLFLLFDFQTEDKLSTNYTKIECLVLLFSYTILSITVGASSTIALKQYFNIYLTFYKKELNLYDCFTKFKECLIILVEKIICCCKRRQYENDNKDKNEKENENKDKIEKENDNLILKYFFIIFQFSLPF